MRPRQQREEGAFAALRLESLLEYLKQLSRFFSRAEQIMSNSKGSEQTDSRSATPSSSGTVGAPRRRLLDASRQHCQMLSTATRRQSAQVKSPS